MVRMLVLCLLVESMVQNLSGSQRAGCSCWKTCDSSLLVTNEKQDCLLHSPTQSGLGEGGAEWDQHR